MRKIIVTEFITLDGVIEAPGGDETNHPHGGWQTKYPAPEVGKYKIDELDSVSTLLLGRKTYDVFAAYWPGQAGTPFGDRLNAYDKFVVSNTLKTAEWNNTKILRDLPTDLAEIKNSEGGNILVYGSGTLVKTLLHHDLVDELRLTVYPLILGGGLKLFADNFEMKKFKLTKSQALESGVQILEFVPAET